MADRTVVHPRSLIEAQPSRAVARWQLGRRAVSIITVLAIIGVGDYFRRFEGSGWHLAYVWSASLFIVFAIVSLTRRLLVATVFLTLLVTIVVQAAAAKHQAMNMSVHAYDLVFYLSSTSTLSFLWASYRAQLILLLAALALFVVALAAAYALDTTRMRRRVAIPLMLAFAVATGWTAAMKGERRNTQQYWEDLVVSTFYSSMPETIETLWRGQLIDAADAAPGPLFTVPATCSTTAGKRPHILLIHQESVVPPEYFPQLGYDKRIDAMFRSGDGSLRKMRVETYGGASWLTEFSILAGVSTYSFGGMRPFVQSLMAGRVHDTLPEALARCGYRNTVIYPLSENFVSNGKFYRAAGIPEIFDKKAQGAKTASERDHFYYATLLNLLSSHIKSSDQPLFTYLITMSAHGPYLAPYHPEVQVPGGAPGTLPEMHEYLRRLSMARIDLEELKRQLAARFPGEPILLVQYGDHQPIATRHYLGYGNVDAAEDVAISRGSPGFVTYYSVEGIGYPTPRLPDVDMLDVPFLSTVILQSAGVPLSDSYLERLRLMNLCKGRYDGCSNGAMLKFHRRLIDSGLVQAR
jgi:phosphoglycerol transferase MdoB-like AlkP superfamily enzyme